MVTQKYAIKSHLTSLLSIVLYQLVFTVKSVKIQLDGLVARHSVYRHVMAPPRTSKVTMVITHAPWYNILYIYIYIYIIYIYIYYIIYNIYVYVITPFECYIRFIITEPEGHRPKGEVIINLI